jgi:hypothetical protein
MAFSSCSHLLWFAFAFMAPFAISGSFSCESPNFFKWAGENVGQPYPQQYFQKCCQAHDKCYLDCNGKNDCDAQLEECLFFTCLQKREGPQLRCSSVNFNMKKFVRFSVSEYRYACEQSQRLKAKTNEF